MNKAVVASIVVGGFVVFLIAAAKSKISAESHGTGMRSEISPDYFSLDMPTIKYYRYATKEDGSTLGEVRLPVTERATPITAGGAGYSRSRQREEENEWPHEPGIGGPGQNYPFFTGGTLIHPEFLPPVRTATIQEGRIIHPDRLPSERTAFIQAGKFVQPGRLPPVRSYQLQ